MLLREFFALNGGDGSVNYGKFAMFYDNKLRFVHKIEDLLNGMNLSFEKCNGRGSSSSSSSSSSSMSGSSHSSSPSHCPKIAWIVGADPEIVRMHFISKGFNPDGGIAQDKVHLHYGALRICISEPVELELIGKTIIRLC